MIQSRSTARCTLQRHPGPSTKLNEPSTTSAVRPPFQRADAHGHACRYLGAIRFSMYTCPAGPLRQSMRLLTGIWLVVGSIWLVQVLVFWLLVRLVGPAFYQRLDRIKRSCFGRGRPVPYYKCFPTLLEIEIGVRHSCVSQSEFDLQ